MLDLKNNLDKRICDVEDTSNTETYREFIIRSEEAFELENVDLDSLDNNTLNSYLNFLDDLWMK